MDIDNCLRLLSQVLGAPTQMLPLHAPCFEGNEWHYVKSCIESGWVSSVGSYVSRFEEKLVEATGIPHAIAVVNGTAALHICLLLAQVKPNDEVLIPSLTFVATANAVTYCGAVPHFVESNSLNLGIDIEKLDEYLNENTYLKGKACINKKTQRQIKAIVPVHIFGHPVDMEALLALSEKYQIAIIEDATESLGSYYKGKHTGHFGLVACLSFNGNKVVTTGGGGAILTKDPVLAKKAKHITTTAKLPHAFEFYHDEIGYNYRLPNINAALGCAQLEQLAILIENKRRLASRYIQVFAGLLEADILQEPEFAKSNYWLNTLILKTPDRDTVKALIEKAHQQHYGLRGLWTPLDRLPMYQHCPKMDLSNTDRLYHSVISLPSSASLGKIYA